MLGKNFNKRYFEIVLQFCPENRIKYFMETVSEETICMKSQILSSEIIIIIIKKKKKKNNKKKRENIVNL